MQKRFNSLAAEPRLAAILAPCFEGVLLRCGDSRTEAEVDRPENKQAKVANEGEALDT